MSMESLNRTSDVIQTPSQIGETPIRVNGCSKAKNNRSEKKR